MSVDARYDSLPRFAVVAAEAVTGARGKPARLMRVFERSPVPMVMPAGSDEIVSPQPSGL